MKLRLTAWFAGCSMLAAAMLMPGCEGGSTGATAWISGTTDSPYDVSGSSIEEVRNDLFDAANGKGALESDGRRYAGSVNYSYVFGLTGTESVGANPGGCGQNAYLATVTLKTISVELEMTVIFPRWDWPEGTPQEQISQWNTFLANLRTHESGHVEIATAGRETIQNALDAKWLNRTGTGTGATPEAAVAAAWEGLRSAVEADFNAQVNEIAAQQDAYDNSTAHGENQGAVL